jgi:anti-sigma factor RsiW
MSERHVPSSDLELYVIDGLDPVRAAQVEEHVGRCAACEAALLSEARLELAFEQVARAPISIATREGPRHLEAQARSIRKSVRRAIPVAGGIVGALAMAAAAVLWLGPQPAGTTGRSAGAPSVATEIDSSQPARDLTDGAVGSTMHFDGSHARANDELDGG